MMVIKETSCSKIVKKPSFQQRRIDCSLLTTDFLCEGSPCGSDHEIRHFCCLNDIYCKSPSISYHQSYKLVHCPQPFQELNKLYYAVQRKRRPQLWECTWALCHPPHLTIQGPHSISHPLTPYFHPILSKGSFTSTKE